MCYNKINMNANILKKIFILLLVLFSIFFYAYKIEPYRLVLKTETLNISNWDSSWDGLKAAVVSDFHIGTGRVPIETLDKAVDLINSQNPDIIFILGDFDAVSIKYSKIPQSKIVEALRCLNAPYGVYAVLGNHDYIPEGVVRPILKSAGIKLLEDDRVKIYINNKPLWVCGIKDLWHYNSALGEVLSDVKSPAILLSHNPDIFPEVPRSVSLTLSGHTHGGEVVLPLLGAPFIPSKYGKKYAKGYVAENGKHLFVTSGIASLSRFRFLNPPEVVMLNLYASGIGTNLR